MSAETENQGRDNASRPSPDKGKFYTRLQELVVEHGNAWTLIAEIMEREGYEEKGEALSPNALRKRYTRWKETDRASRPRPVKREPSDSSEPEDSPPGQRDRQLVEELRSLKREVSALNHRLEETEKRRDQGSPDDDRVVTVKDLIELIQTLNIERETMHHGPSNTAPPRDHTVSDDEILSAVREPLQEEIQEIVDRELKGMLEGDSVRHLIVGLLDERLKSFMGDITLKEHHRGPGRGRTGKTHKKFSASLPEELFLEVKSLPGMFSAHLDAALRLYLKVLKGGEGEEGG